MSDDAKDAGETAAPVKAKPGKKKLVIIGAAAVLLLGGGGGAYMMMGGKPAEAKAHGTEAAAEEDAPAAEEEGGEHGGAGEKETPLDVPPLLVNLRTPDGAPHFLKIHFVLSPGPKSNLEELKKELPVLLDAYQPFLRELRPEDLAGSAAVFRIKEELLVRSRDAIGAGKVKDVLIQDLVQQ
ncbi:MAG TPA: flagellar basal body-associated FliL family protein [Sphingomonas sp.]|nr:flagellar basal body-associated FliL family protein [Sphingomonas sp.]